MRERWEIKNVNGEEVVVDHEANLMWQRDNAPEMTWDKAVDHAENLELAGFSDWRLPTAEELETLFTEKRGRRFLWNDSLWNYVGNHEGNFWSSTETKDPEEAKRVIFYRGVVHTGVKRRHNYVKCVRNINSDN